MMNNNLQPPLQMDEITVFFLQLVLPMSQYWVHLTLKKLLKQFSMHDFTITLAKGVCEQDLFVTHNTMTKKH